MQASASATMKQTITTYLSPLNSPVTEFATISKRQYIFIISQLWLASHPRSTGHGNSWYHLTYMPSLAKRVNMPHVNVFLDVGAAMKAYKLVWNYPDKFSNVLVLLGDFHFMKEIFNVVGTMTDGSGFNDIIIFQANLCSSESLASVINGSHHNRCWRVHEPFVKAVERLLMEKFIDYKQLAIPEAVIAFTESTQVKDNDETVVNDEGVQEFRRKMQGGRLWKNSTVLGSPLLGYYRSSPYDPQCSTDQQFRSSNDCMGKDAAVLLCYEQNKLLKLWLLLSESFSTRYPGASVPGCKDLLLSAGLSVQAQDHYPHSTAIDQRGEQSVIRDTKTAGRIKKFYSSESSILKWTLNRAHQWGHQSANTSESGKRSGGSAMSGICRTCEMQLSFQKGEASP